MTDLFLGLIAVGVVVMATIQVALVVFAVRAATRAGEAAKRLEQQVAPIMTNLQTMSGEVARASALLTAQVERVDHLSATVAKRVEDTAAALHDTVVRPMAEGVNLLRGVKAAVSAFREARPRRDGDPAPAAPRDPASQQAAAAPAEPAAPAPRPPADDPRPPGDDPQLFV